MKHAKIRPIQEKEDSAVIEWVHGIPNDLFVHDIFPYVSTPTLLYLRTVCVYWNHHIPPIITSLNLDGISKVTKSLYNVLHKPHIPRSFALSEDHG